MKVVVSSIMLDEPLEFIERWAKSALDADEMVLVDTGSSPEQIGFARHLGITVHEIAVRPWRFDVARNTALALLPADADPELDAAFGEIGCGGDRLGGVG